MLAHTRVLSEYQNGQMSIHPSFTKPCPPGAGGPQYSILLCLYYPPGNGPGLPYGGAVPPSQAVGEEESTLAPPLQEGVGDGGGYGGDGK